MLDEHAEVIREAVKVIAAEMMEIEVSELIGAEDLADEDLTTFEGIPIVTPARAIRQAAAAHLGSALIGQAIDHAERDGRLTRRAAEKLRRELNVERGSGVRR